MIYIFCLLMVGRLFRTDSWIVTIRINTCIVLCCPRTPRPLLSLKITSCQLHNKITAYSNFEFIWRHGTWIYFHWFGIEQPNAVYKFYDYPIKFRGFFFVPSLPWVGPKKYNYQKAKLVASDIVPSIKFILKAGVEDSIVNALYR
jgi:hypothetical protein